ncbi:MAG: ROK family protein [Clostridiales bacterium]|nr:ROK family protein [Clostridiales bacterium]
MKIGIDLGGSHISIGVVDKDGKILDKRDKHLRGIAKRLIKSTIEETIISNIKEYQKNYKITEIGIAVPGSVKNDKILKSVNLGLKDYDLVGVIKKEIDLPIKIRNDAKCAALAESKYGALKKYNRVLFMTLGTGIGGAVIINGKLLDAGEYPGCEFGHMVIKENGLECNCGRKGCFEKYGSMRAFKDNLRNELGLEDKTSGKELMAILKNTTKESKDYAKIEKVRKQYIRDLSVGITNLVNIFEPEAIGIGGSFVYFSEALLDDIKELIIKENMLFNSRKEINIQTAVLGNEAGIIGAIL